MKASYENHYTDTKLDDNNSSNEVICKRNSSKVALAEAGKAAASTPIQSPRNVTAPEMKSFKNKEYHLDVPIQNKSSARFNYWAYKTRADTLAPPLLGQKEVPQGLKFFFF